jgi:hypothetical protein
MHYATIRKVADSSPDEVIGFLSIDLIHPAALWPWGTRNILGGKGRPARRAVNLAAIYEPVV